MSEPSKPSGEGRVDPATVIATGLIFSIAGLLLCLNVSGGLAVFGFVGFVVGGGIGMVVGAVISIVSLTAKASQSPFGPTLESELAPLAASPAAATPTPPASQQQEPTAADLFNWIIRILLIAALLVFFYDRVQLEIAKNKVAEEIKKLAPK